MDTVIGFIIAVAIFGPIVVRILRGIFWVGSSVATVVAPNSALSRAPRAFQTQLQPVAATSEDDRFHFELQCRGGLRVRPGCRLMVETWLSDVTGDGERKPVLSMIDWQQHDDSTVFRDVTTFGTWSAPIFGPSEWAPLQIRIWPEVLRAPYSGTRDLKLAVLVRDELNENEAFYFHELDFRAELPEVGWLEFSERRQADAVAAVRLAMAVAAADGALEAPELLVIKDWATEQISFLDDEDRAEQKAKLNDAIRSASRQAAQGGLDLAVEIEHLRDSGTSAGRLEAVELCLAVTSADGQAHTAALERVNRIAQQLEVEGEWFSESRDKALSGVGVLGSSAADYAALLGLDLSLPRDDLRRELNGQYEKWNSRAVSLQDAEKRAEAERMLETIAEARELLLSDATVTPVEIPVAAAAPVLLPEPRATPREVTSLPAAVSATVGGAAAATVAHVTIDVEPQPTQAPVPRDQTPPPPASSVGSPTPVGAPNRGWPWAGLVFLLILGIAGFAAYMSSQDTTTAPAASATATQNATTSGSTSPPPVDPTMSDYEVAQAEQSVLARSAGARRLAIRGNSQPFDQGIADFQNAIYTRQTLIYEVKGWDVPASVAKVRRALVVALKASIVSDRYYLEGVRDRSYGGSGSYPTQQGIEHDNAVTNPRKLAALEAYNALRARAGLAPISTSYRF